MKRKAKKVRFCRKCGANRCIQRHHVFPRVHYGQSVRVLLCQDCHRCIEERYTFFEGVVDGRRKKLSKQEYLDIMLDFLMEEVMFYQDIKIDSKRNLAFGAITEDGADLCRACRYFNGCPLIKRIRRLHCEHQPVVVECVEYEEIPDET